MGAHIEWVCPNVGALRAGKDFHSIVTHDPYEFVATVTITGTIATFKAGRGSYGALVLERDAIRGQLPDYVRFVTWERFKDGKGRVMEVGI